MFGAKTLDKTLGWLRQSLAHDLAPNMVKLLCMYLIWFSMKHGIKTDSIKTGVLFCINSFASNMKRNQYKWGKNIAKTGNIHNYILHVCGKNIHTKTTYQEHWICFKSCFMLNHS